jgi:hypothetical protein
MHRLFQRAVNNKLRHNSEKEGITLQLEQHALAGRDLRTSLAHSLERPGHLFFVAARYPIGENVHVIPALEQVQGRL